MTDRGAGSDIEEDGPGMMTRPEATEYALFYAGYIARVPEGSILEVLERQPAEVRRALAAVPGERETYRYAPDKWSIREVLGHIGDAERIFGYRALRIGRGDETPLPGFDEKPFVAASGADARPLADLLDEFATVRAVNLIVLRHLPEAAWGNWGTANDKPVTTRAVAYTMAGHVLHHMAVLRERYGVGAAER
jgi:hypothetical protein